MVFYAFNIILVMSQHQLTNPCILLASPVLGWALKCLAQGLSHQKSTEDPVLLGLQVTHFTTVARGTPPRIFSVIEEICPKS